MLDKGLVDHVLADIKIYLKGCSCPSGTGKTSLAFVIASELQLDIYVLSLNSSDLGGLTLSSMLNALDGPATPEGYILIMTTNYCEKLDNTLICPGWIDMEVLFSYADKNIIRDLFSCLYDPFNQISSKISNNRIPDLAMEFMSQVPGGKFTTTVEIQGYLL
ncbi:rieske ISP assembly protein [Coccidioides immitis H538.4]|uniref:Rieske ISP assembly protein n=1 Tax=Coccidioides immitis H538.4 TaxID=396776 RepID=A0A0J8RJZ3_COCIT|nr:rieske ISP assembly protein [Coccidioides immitis H538.4]